MNFGIGSFAYRWSIGRPYYRPENPMTVDQLIDRCIAHGVKTVLLCNNIFLHEFNDAQLGAIRDRLAREGMQVDPVSHLPLKTAEQTPPGLSGRCETGSIPSAR